MTHERIRKWLPIVALMIELQCGGQVFQELYAFCHSTPAGWDCTDGGSPQGTLIQATDGNLHGTTTAGGQYGYGTIFRITPEGSLSIVASFDGTNGVTPSGGLVQASDGNFYGTTLGGGPGYPRNMHYGTIFKMTPGGSPATIRPFDGLNGSSPVGDLVEGPDAKLYGVTHEGGSAGSGTVFRASTDGVLETLAEFTEITGDGGNGGYPAGGLLLASDGNFYGTTSSGGPGGYGTVFRMTTNGTLTTLAGFYQGPGNAVYPVGRLLQTGDGNLYGAAGGGADTIFKCSLDGTLTTFARFGSEGEDPVGGLVQARDGALYGSCYAGGTNCCPPYGTVFRLDLSQGCTNQTWETCGNLTALFSFTGYGGQYSGAYPHAGLTLGSDGNLYGTTDSGGAPGGGNIFRIIMPGPLLTINQPQSTINQLVLSWRTNYTGYFLQSCSDLDRENWTDCTNSLSVIGGQYFVTNSLPGSSRFFRLSRISQQLDPDKDHGQHKGLHHKPKPH